MSPYLCGVKLKNGQHETDRQTDHNSQSPEMGMMIVRLSCAA